MKSIIEQLVEMYYKEEWWHKIIMPPDEAFDYHREHCEKGDIYTHVKDGVVLGYYERYFNGDICFLANLYVRGDLRRSKVTKELYKHFLDTMPPHINYIVGEKQKVGGKMQKVKIRSS